MSTKKRKFITPSLVDLLFILAAFGALGSVLLGALFSFTQAGVGPAIGTLLLGGLSAAVWLLFVRVACELSLVVFQINENLQTLVDRR